MRALVRFPAFPLVNLMPGFEYAEAIEVFRVLHNIAVDARE